MARQLTDQYPQWTQRMAEGWDGICKMLIFIHPTLAAQLCNATPVAVIGKEGEFVLFILVWYAPHLEQLATLAATHMVEEILQRLYDRVTIHIRFIGPESVTSAEGTPVPAGVSPTGTPPLASPPALSPKAQQAPLQQLLALWEYIKRASKLKSPKAMALLQETTPKLVTSLKPPELLVEVSSEEAYQKLSESRYRSIVGWAVAAVSGIPYHVQFLREGDPLPAPVVEDAPKLEEVLKHWDLIQKGCKTRSPRVAALLLQTKPVVLLGADGHEVVIQVEFDFHYQQLSEPANKRLVEEMITVILEKPCRVRFIRKEEPIPTW